MADTIRVLIIVDSKGHDAIHFSELMQELIPEESLVVKELGLSFKFTVQTPDDYQCQTKLLKSLIS